MEWKYVKPLSDVTLPDQLAQETGCPLSPAFRQWAKEHNGGRPSLRLFDTDQGRGRVIKSFLSLNREDRETVWKMLDWAKEDLAGRYVPFAIDPAGNLVCLEKATGAVAFLDHETGAVERAAGSFEAFLRGLYGEGPQG